MGADRQGVATTMHEAWSNLMRADKIRVFEDMEAGTLSLPKLPDGWGPVTHPSRVPCVVWVKQPKVVTG